MAPYRSPWLACLVPSGVLAAAVVWLTPDVALADNACRMVEVRMNPAGAAATSTREAIGPQIAVWVEDKDGRFIDTLYVTSATGLLGMGNRPGRWNMKTDFRWPYGRRPSSLPIWAYKRGKTYPKVLMGGACSDNNSCSGDIHNGASRSDDDDTIAYHGSVSSDEPYFCAPSRVSPPTPRARPVDVVSCASTAPTLSKGYLSKTETSVYPPRGDIAPARYRPSVDSVDIKRFASLNDVAAVSGATPALGKVMDPPVRWSVPATLPAGDYVLKVEVNQEGDFNQSFQPSGAYQAVIEKHPEWDTGFQWNGQPSILYAVPFRLDGAGQAFLAADYAGYGDRLGESGKVTAPDGTISTSNGSGVDRLKLVQDADGAWRVKVTTVACDGTCVAPQSPALSKGVSSGSTLTVKLQLPAGAPQGTVLELRYSMGTPISDENFNSAVPVQSPPMSAAGEAVQAQINGLLPKTQYFVAARAKAPCGAVSPVVTLDSLTDQATYTTLSGCFIATAAYGSPMMREVDRLRSFRDRYLLTNATGQLLVASYYAVSPPLAGVIAERDGARSLVRSWLTPVVKAVGILLAR